MLDRLVDPVAFGNEQLETSGVSGNVENDLLLDRLAVRDITVKHHPRGRQQCFGRKITLDLCAATPDGGGLWVDQPQLDIRVLCVAKDLDVDDVKRSRRS